MDQLLACLVSVAEQNNVSNFQSLFQGLQCVVFTSNVLFQDQLLACLVSVAEVSRWSAFDKLLREMCGYLFPFLFKSIGANLQLLVAVR